MPLAARAVLLGSLCLASPAETPQPDPEPDLREPNALPKLTFVASLDLDREAFASELSLRMPELELSNLDSAPPGREFVYIQARRETERIHRVAIILSDGRAYYEHIDVGEAGSPERVLASAIANLLFSIESGEVEPDERDVRAPPAGESAEALEPEPAEAPATEPQLKDSADAPASTALPAPLELGLGLGLSQATALGAPMFANRHLGWFGGLGLELRTVRGLFASAELRPGGARVGDYGLTRIGVGLGLGVAWRVRQLELVAALTATVTPWFVASEGEVEAVTKIDDGARGRPPLLNFGARFSPGYRIELEDRGPLRSLRLGPHLGLSGGFVTSAPPRVAGLQAPGGRELFRLGGVELDLGFELTLWMAPRPRRR